MVNRKIEGPQPLDGITTVEIKKFGDSLGIVLTEDVLAHLAAGVGDQLFLTAMPEGGLNLARRNPASTEAMDIARRGMVRYRNALAKLAE